MNRTNHFLSTSRTALILLLATLLTAAQTAGADILPGSGTPDDPYQISSSNDWMTFSEAIRKSGNAYADKCYKLMQNITVEGAYSLQSPHDVRVIGFYGTFDGGDHTLTFNYSSGNYSQGTRVYRLTLADDVTTSTAPVFSYSGTD